MSLPRPIATGQKDLALGVLVACCLLIIAVALPGSDHDSALSPPWMLITDPLGGTWLSLMALFGGIGLGLLRPSRWRGALALIMGWTASWLGGEALARGSQAGNADLAGTLELALGGPWVGRLLLLVLLTAVLSAPFIAAGQRSSMPRWITVGVGVTVVVLMAAIGLLGMGDGAVSSPAKAVLDAMGSGAPVGDRIAAIFALLGVLSVVGAAAVHALLDDTTIHRGAAWTVWSMLVFIPLLVIALFAAPSQAHMFALEAVKMSLVIAGGLLLAAVGIGALLSPQESGRTS